jgi:hypothetical protein
VTISPNVICIWVRLYLRTLYYYFSIIIPYHINFMKRYRYFCLILNIFLYNKRLWYDFITIMATSIFNAGLLFLRLVTEFTVETASGDFARCVQSVLLLIDASDYMPEAIICRPARSINLEQFQSLRLVPCLPPHRTPSHSSTRLFLADFPAYISAVASTLCEKARNHNP